MAGIGGGTPIIVGGAIPATPLEWSTASVSVWQATLVQVNGKSVAMYALSVNNIYVGSFQYSTARALHASLTSLKLVKKLPKFPKRGGTGEKGKSQCRDMLESYFKAICTDERITASPVLVHFLKGLKKVTQVHSQMRTPQRVQSQFASPRMKKNELSQSMNNLHIAKSPNQTPENSRASFKKRMLSDSVHDAEAILDLPLSPEQSERSVADKVGPRRQSTPAIILGSTKERRSNTVARISEAVEPLDLGDPPSTLPYFENVKINNGDELVCISSQISKVPSWFAEYYSHKVTKVDLSDGSFEDLSPLSGMVKLETLIADSNRITSANLPQLPALPTLTTLSLNRNKIESILAFIGFCAEKYPRLSFLSLIGNPCCCDELSGHSEADYLRYRKQLVLAFPQLGWIDSTTTAQDRTTDGYMSCPNLTVSAVPTWIGLDQDVLGFDFSHSSITDISLLAKFSKLDTLVLDHCSVQEISNFPCLPTLRAFSLNFNDIVDIHKFLKYAQKLFGSMTFLSLLGNPCCPSEQFGNCTEEQYELYRAYVTMALPELQYLDSRSTDFKLDPDPPWFMDGLSKEDATTIVLGANTGDFLVVPGEDCFVLIVNDFGTVATFTIRYDGMRFDFGGKIFWAVESVIAYGRSIDLCGRSGRPLKLGQAAVEVLVGDDVSVDMSPSQISANSTPDVVPKATGRVVRPPQDLATVVYPTSTREGATLSVSVPTISSMGLSDPGLKVSLGSHTMPQSPPAEEQKISPAVRAIDANGVAVSISDNSPSEAKEVPLLPDGLDQTTTRVTVVRESREISFGFGLGATDKNHNMITYVKNESPAYGWLETGDILVSLNGSHVVGRSHTDIIREISQSMTLVMEVIRQDLGVQEEAHRAVTGVMFSRVVSEFKGKKLVSAEIASLNQDTMQQEEELAEMNEPMGTIPESYEWSLWSSKYSYSLADVQKSLFSAELWEEYYLAQKFTGVTITQWKNKKRTASYTMPGSALKPKTFVQENQEIIIDSRKLVIVDVRSTTPGVPYGNSFATHVQYRLEKTDSGCTIAVTAEAQWSKKCSLKGTITKKINTAMQKSFKQIQAFAEQLWRAASVA